MERLVGSQSVYSAIERQIGLRSLDKLGIFLILIWLLSPLGGQASLRILSTEPRTVIFNSTAQYFPVEGYTSSLIGVANSVTVSWPLYAPLYMTSLHGSRTHINSSMDQWEGIKIPDITSSANMTEDNWRHFGEVVNVTYSSLLGIPVAGVPRSGNSSFDMVSHYWSVDCDEFNSTTTWWNTSGVQIPGSAPYDNFLSFRMDMPPLRPTDDWRQPMKFTYTSLRDDVIDNEQANVSMADCSAKIVFVQSRVECTGRDCRVAAMRYVDHPNQPFPNFMFFQITKAFPGTDVGLIMSRRAISRSGMTENWIMNPATTFDFTSTVDDNYMDLASLSPQVFSKRLQMVINTFWDSTAANTYRNANLTLDNNTTTCPEESCNPIVSFNSTQLTGTKIDGTRYVCRKTFAIITTAISAIILASAIYSLVLAAYMTLAPDVLGYVSTYLRDNQYAHIHASSNLDGLDTARILGDVKVMIGDVKSQETVGHISIATAGPAVEQLSKKRMYD